MNPRLETTWYAKVCKWRDERYDYVAHVDPGLSPRYDQAIERRRTANSNISKKGRSSVRKGTWDPESCTYEHYHLAYYIKVPHSSFVLRHSVVVALHLPFSTTTLEHEFLQVKAANTNWSCARHPRHNPEIRISCTRERGPEKSAAFKSHQPDLDMLIFLPPLYLDTLFC